MKRTPHVKQENGVLIVLTEKDKGKLINLREQGQLCLTWYRKTKSQQQGKDSKQKRENTLGRITQFLWEPLAGASKKFYEH